MSVGRATAIILDKEGVMGRVALYVIMYNKGERQIPFNIN
jgi:hypothetical protein